MKKKKNIEYKITNYLKLFKKYTYTYAHFFFKYHLAVVQPGFL